MPDIAELQVIIDADTRGFDAGIKHVERETKGLGDSVAKGIGAGIGFGVIEKGLGALTAGFGAAKGAVIDLNSSLEQSKIAFTTMLGSAEAADDFLANLQKFAAETPFEFPDLVTASKRMFAFGFESKQVIPLLTAVGDAVAAVGGGADVIDGVTTALGQMQAKGKVSAEEMNQLAERGIPAWDMLAKKMGVSVAEAMEASAKGQVKAQTMLEAFQEGTAQRFGGMMAKQSKTFAGAMSTITDSVQMAMARGFKPFFDLLSRGAIALAGFLSSQSFAAWADRVAASLNVVGATLAGLVAAFAGIETADITDPWDQLTDSIGLLVAEMQYQLQPVFDWVIDHGDAIKAVFTGAAAGIATLLASSAVVPIITAVGSALMLLLSPIALVAAAGAALALAWQNNWLNIRTYVNDAVTWITTVAVPTLQNMLGAAMTYLSTTVVPMLQFALDAFVGWMMTTLVPTLTTVWTWLQANVGGALTWLTTTAWPLLQAAASAVTDWIGDTLVPTLTDWYRWLDDKLRPIYEWFIDKGWPMLGNAANAVQNWIKDTLIPTLGEWWRWLQDRLSPIYQWFIDYGWPKLKEAGSAVWSWLTTSLFPTLSEWYEWFQDRLSPIYQWFIDYGWPKLKEAGSAFVSWVTGEQNPALAEWWSWIGDKAHSAADWWINTGYPGLTKAAKDNNAEVRAGAQFWNDFTAALAKTDAAEHWANILDNLNRFAHYLVTNIDLKGWFSGVGEGIAISSGWLDYFAEFTNWILKTLDKLTSWLPGEKVPSVSNPPSAPGGAGSGGGGGGGGTGNAPAPPSWVPTPSGGGGGGGGGGSAPAPSPSPTPSPTPAPSPSPPSSGGAMPQSKAEWEALTAQMGGEYNLGSWFVNQIRQESGFNTTIKSPVGAYGIGQFMPDTGNAVADRMGVSRSAFWADPRLQLRGAAFHMNELMDRYERDPIAALVGYNAGTGNADYLRPFLHNPPKEIWELENTWKDKQPRHYIKAILGMARGGMINEPILGVGASGQRYAFGERGPEYIVPASATAGGGFDRVRVDIAVAGHVAESIYVTGRNLAIRSGRVASGAS